MQLKHELVLEAAVEYCIVYDMSRSKTLARLLCYDGLKSWPPGSICVP